MKTFKFNEINIIVGENAKENWDILNTNKNYWWFHLKSFPSCHVIIEDENPNNLEILEAASLCKKYTKYKNMNNLKINYTQIKNLKKSIDVGSVEFNSNRKVLTISI